MAHPNRSFDLSIEDMELIETALRVKKRALNEARMDGELGQTGAETVREIHELLGRLHNQKQFYRPKAGIYVSG